jgi:hypothetical protein
MYLTKRKKERTKMEKENKIKKIKRRKVSVLALLESNVLKSVKELRDELPNAVTLCQLESHVALLADKGKVWLHRHAFPAIASREEILKIEGETYCGLTLRD